MKAATHDDVVNNEAIAKAIVQNEPPHISGVVGMHALGKLAEIMPHAEFSEFVNGILGALKGEQQAPENETPAEDQTESQAAPVVAGGA